jgi:hypothetical protein
LWGVIPRSQRRKTTFFRPRILANFFMEYRSFGLRAQR